jgi:hypothetical protein
MIVSKSRTRPGGATAPNDFTGRRVDCRGVAAAAFDIHFDLCNDIRQLVLIRLHFDGHVGA